MFFKIIYNSGNRKIESVIKWLHLYHPPLLRLKQLSEGRPETLVVRSKEFSNLLNSLRINGVDKFTFSGRLAVLNEWLISVMPKPISASMSILDVGGSDGITTFELVRYLQENLGVDVKASVLESQLRLYSFRGRLVRYYLTNEKIPFTVCYKLGPWGY